MLGARSIEEDFLADTSKKYKMNNVKKKNKKKTNPVYDGIRKPRGQEKRS